MTDAPKLISPWKLTPKEAAAMDAMCEHGTAKLAARAIKRSPKTVEAHVASASTKMGATTGARLVKYIRWARWRWEERQVAQKAQCPYPGKCHPGFCPCANPKA